MAPLFTACLHAFRPFTIMIRVQPLFLYHCAAFITLPEEKKEKLAVVFLSPLLFSSVSLCPLGGWISSTTRTINNPSACFAALLCSLLPKKAACLEGLGFPSSWLVEHKQQSKQANQEQQQPTNETRTGNHNPRSAAC